MTTIRHASKADNFPYMLRTTCWICVDREANVSYLGGDVDRVAGLALAYKDQATLYAVWPGRWRSDLFLIDDLAAAAKAFGIDLGEPPQAVAPEEPPF